ncbi:hypothetical protein QIS74_04478 [Colletotrichum tabaci]|uniref:Uncharacterized protein n=1 Tax=Colletotrichum tabaci TaxID=1209068 RepID=A0AAV9TIP2_9PEZI
MVDFPMSRIPRFQTVNRYKRVVMALELYIPPCIRTPASRLHPPRIESPLRVQIEDVRPDIPGDMAVRDEYMGWVKLDEKILEEIDYYGVTFDHLVSDDDVDPEVLQINIIETDNDDAEYANTYLPFSVDASEYTGKRV